jgi:hypothetical protein
VHGVIFEFEDGSRSGVLMENNTEIVPLLDDQTIMSRGSKWISVVKPGDYIVGVSGYQLIRSATRYLCHTLNLQFASGQSMSFASRHRPWQGDEFSYTMPSQSLFLVNKLIFDTVQGCRGFDGSVTSVHLCVDRSTVVYLPRPCKNTLQLLLLIANRIDSDRIAEGEKAISGDIWWSILSYLEGYDVLGRATSALVVRESGTSRSTSEAPSRRLVAREFGTSRSTSEAPSSANPFWYLSSPSL